MDKYDYRALESEYEYEKIKTIENISKKIEIELEKITDDIVDLVKDIDIKITLHEYSPEREIEIFLTYET